MSTEERALLDERALTPTELREKLQLGVSTFYKYQAEGRFEPFELTPRIGPRRYSRKAVQAYLDRENDTTAPRRLRRAG